MAKKRKTVISLLHKYVINKQKTDLHIRLLLVPFSCLVIRLELCIKNESVAYGQFQMRPRYEVERTYPIRGSPNRCWVAWYAASWRKLLVFLGYALCGCFASSRARQEERNGKVDDCDFVQPSFGKFSPARIGPNLHVCPLMHFCTMHQASAFLQLQLYTFRDRRRRGMGEVRIALCSATIQLRPTCGLKRVCLSFSANYTLRGRHVYCECNFKDHLNTKSL